MTQTEIRGVSLFVDVVGNGPPLVLMHGGPGADHWTMQPFRRLSDRFTTVFYDHRCNGRSTGAAVETMTFDNLTADADALRETLGFDRWAVLGHSFGGHGALEYALRYRSDSDREHFSRPPPPAHREACPHDGSPQPGAKRFRTAPLSPSNRNPVRR